MSETETNTETTQKNKKMLVILSSVAVGMLLFGVFILPPFYRMACKIVGVDLNPDNDVELGAVDPDANAISVSFQARVLDNLPVRFYAEHKKAKIKPGEAGFNTFYFENLSNETVYIRPLHTVTPSFAAAEFDMRVCFCFNDQELGPGEKREYPIEYSFSKEIDGRVARSLVRYDLHRIEKSQMKPFQPGPTAIEEERVAEKIEAAKDE